MKIQEEYPNFKSALFTLISDKNPVLGSNDSKKFCYFIPLASHNKGFDYYELNRSPSGGVYFSIVTMLGFRTILETNSELYHDDLSQEEWFSLIYKIVMKHFTKEEYIALKQGYAKTKQGCFSSVLLGILIIISFLVIGISN